MVLISSNLSIITPNVSGLNPPIEGHRVTERIKQKQYPTKSLLIRDSFQHQGHTETQSKEIENYTPCAWKPKESKCSYIYIHIKQNRL